MKVTRIFLNIMSVVCFVYGALYCFSLVFIPVGVYCFIAGRKFSYKAEHMFDLYTIDNKTIKNYTIFVCIACFPFGLLALIPCYMLLSGKASVSEFKATRVTDVDTQEKIVETNEDDSKPEVQVEAQTMQEVSEEEKQEKFEKLKNFKEKGIITEDEFEMAKKQLFGDEEK